MKNWIKIEDRLPEDDNLKLIWFAKGTHFPDISYGGFELAFMMENIG